MPDSSASSGGIMLKLRSLDNRIVLCTKKAAFQATILKTLYTDLGLDKDLGRLEQPIPVKVSGWVLNKLVEWCEENRDLVWREKEDWEDPRIVLTPADIAYMDVTGHQLEALLNGASHMGIGGVVDIITQKIANMAEGRSVEELREIFGLVNDFSPEEEQELKDRFAWLGA